MTATTLIIASVRWNGDVSCLKDTLIEKRYKPGAVERIDKAIEIRDPEHRDKREFCQVGDWLVLVKTERGAELQVWTGDAEKPVEVKA